MTLSVQVTDVQKAVHIVDIVLAVALGWQHVQESLDNRCGHLVVQSRFDFVIEIDGEVLLRP